MEENGINSVISIAQEVTGRIFQPSVLENLVNDGVHTDQGTLCMADCVID